MRKSIGIAAALALAGCGGNGGEGGNSGGGGGGGSAGLTMQPGQWEMTTTVTRMNMPGMPAGMNATPPPNTTRDCLTPEEVARANADFVRESAGEGCTSQNSSMSGGRIQANIQCDRPEGQTRMTMNGTYTATTLDMTQQVRTTIAGGQTVEMDARMTGRRIGECPAGEENG
jgi:hypothetical protein